MVEVNTRLAHAGILSRGAVHEYRARGEAPRDLELSATRDPSPR
jgi:hypothetical protein